MLYIGTFAYLQCAKYFRSKIVFPVKLSYGGLRPPLRGNIVTTEKYPD